MNLNKHNPRCTRLTKDRNFQMANNNANRPLSHQQLEPNVHRSVSIPASLDFRSTCRKCRQKSVVAVKTAGTRPNKFFSLLDNTHEELDGFSLTAVRHR